MVAVVVEDNTGLATANSYVSVQEFTDYFLDRLVDISDYEAPAIMVAVVESTRYADSRWGSRFKGKPLSATQALEFPRANLYDRYMSLVSGVPQNFKVAIILYAKAYLDGSLYPVVSAVSSKEIAKKKVTVGPITTETEFVGKVSSDTPLSFPQQTNLIQPYVSCGKGVMR